MFMPMMLRSGSTQINAVLLADIRNQVPAIWRVGLVVDADDIQTGIRVIGAQGLTGPAVDTLGSVANHQSPHARNEWCP